MIIILIYSVKEILNSFPVVKTKRLNSTINFYVIVKDIVSMQIFNSIKKNKIRI